MATSLSIKGKTQANDAVTSTINYVNPLATDEQLISLATAFNNLTTNTTNDITRIDKNSLINKIEKQPRNMILNLSGSETPVTSIQYSSIAAENLDNPTVYYLSYSGYTTSDTLTIKYTYSGSGDGRNTLFMDTYNYNDNIQICMTRYDAENPPALSAITFIVPETDTYAAGELTVTFT